MVLMQKVGTGSQIPSELAALEHRKIVFAGIKKLFGDNPPPPPIPNMWVNGGQKERAINYPPQPPPLPKRGMEGTVDINF